MNIFDAIDIIVRRPELETVFEEPLASGAGPDVYYYAGGLTDTAYTDDSWNFSTGTTHVGSAVTVAQGGTATKLGMKVELSTYVGTVILFLLNSSDTSLASETVVFTGEDILSTWIEVTINQAVSSGTYKVLASATTTSGYIKYYCESDQGDGVYSETDYPGPPVDLLANTDTLAGVRIYVD